MKGKKIFVSSTFVDLEEHRHSVRQAIRKSGAIDISMEDFGARPRPPLDECLRIIQEDAEFFIGIYAHRYGFIPKNSEKSITELEYDEAKRKNIPILVFVIDENHPWKKRFIDFGEQESKLNKFKQKIGSEKIWATFTNKDSLASVVIASLIREINYRGIKSIDNTVKLNLTNTNQWYKHRNETYKKNQGLFLAHTLSPSKYQNQEYDIFIFLKKHKHEEINISEVDFVEFYFGLHWNNQIFKVNNTGGFIGINLSAFGEFLCTSQVTLKDGTKILLDRYIDFSNGSN